MEKRKRKKNERLIYSTDKEMDVSVCLFQERFSDSLSHAQKRHTERKIERDRRKTHTQSKYTLAHTPWGDPCPASINTVKLITHPSPSNRSLLAN